MKEFRGKFTESQVMQALAKTRLNEVNKVQMIKFFVHGVRLKDLDISKQAAS